MLRASKCYDTCMNNVPTEAVQPTDEPPLNDSSATSVSTAQQTRSPDLSRERIARAALALVDAEGAEALTFRRLAGELGVPAPTIYSRVSNRESLIKDVVALLTDEIDTSFVPGEKWPDVLRRVARSHRTMALRHPRAYELFTSIPFDDYPVIDHTIRVLRLHDPEAISDEQRFRFLSVMKSFTSGFLTMEIQVLLREEEAGRKKSPFDRHPNPVADQFAQIIRGNAFEHGLDVIIEGFKRVDFGK